MTDAIEPRSSAAVRADLEKLLDAAREKATRVAVSEADKKVAEWRAQHEQGANLDQAAIQAEIDKLDALTPDKKQAAKAN